MIEAPMLELTHYEHLLDFLVKMQELYPKVDSQVEAEGWETVSNFEYIENLHRFENRLADLWGQLASDLARLFMNSTPGRVISLRQESGKVVPSFSDNDVTLVRRVQDLVRGTMEMYNGHIDTYALDCLDELERLVQSDKSAKALVTPLVAHTVGKLCVLREACRQLYANQPWYRASTHLGIYDPNPVKLFGGKDYSLYRASLEYEILKKRLYEPARPDLDPEKFEYPIDGQYWAWYDSMHAQAAELAVDMFWSSFDKYWDKFDMDHQIKSATTSFRTPARGRAVKIMKGWSGLVRVGNWATFETRKTAKDVAECGLKLQVRSKSGWNRLDKLRAPHLPHVGRCVVLNSPHSSTPVTKANTRTETTPSPRPPRSNLCR